MKYQLLAALVSSMLYACTGTSEATVPSLLGVATGSKVNFYKTDELNFEGTTPNPTVSLSITEPILDMLHTRRNKQDYLWVLTAKALYQYNPLGLTNNSAPVGTFAQDCPDGYLELGRERLLVACEAVAGGTKKVSYVGLSENTLTLTPYLSLGEVAKARFGLDGSDNLIGVTSAGVLYVPKLSDSATFKPITKQFLGGTPAITLPSTAAVRDIEKDSGNGVLISYGSTPNGNLAELSGTMLSFVVDTSALQNYSTNVGGSATAVFGVARGGVGDPYVVGAGISNLSQYAVGSLRGLPSSNRDALNYSSNKTYLEHAIVGDNLRLYASETSATQTTSVLWMYDTTTDITAAQLGKHYRKFTLEGAAAIAALAFVPTQQ